MIIGLVFGAISSLLTWPLPLNMMPLASNLPMTEAIAKGVVAETTKAFLSRTELVWGNAIDRLLEVFHDGIQDYLERYQARFSWTKTFLHRDPVYFYDIYFPLKLQRRGKEIAVKH